MSIYKFYVPEHLAEGVKEIALKECGGYTAYPGAEGGWVSPDGDIILDNITVIEIFTSVGLYIEEPIGNYLIENGEQAVAFVVDGMAFVPDHDEVCAALAATEREES